MPSEPPRNPARPRGSAVNALIVGASLARDAPYLIVLAAGAALALAARGVPPAKPALARVHAERRRHRGR